jgi:hypothetical protein
MANLYFIQLIGVLVTGLGMVALTASYYLYGKPLSRNEEFRMNRTGKGFRRMPLNLETIVSALFFLGGMGILTWSKFNPCAFLNYWLPAMPDAIMFLLSCS